jgi:hypothetical protein
MRRRASSLTPRTPKLLIVEPMEQAWNLVPERWRLRCLAHLKAEMEKDSASRDILEGWRTAKRNGVSVSSTDSFFHFGVGMWVRNTLRDVLLRLPGTPITA